MTWLSTGEAAERYRVDRRTIYQWARRGILRSLRPSGRGGKLLVALVESPPSHQETPRNEDHLCNTTESETSESRLARERTAQAPTKSLSVTELVGAVDARFADKRRRKSG